MRGDRPNLARGAQEDRHRIAQRGLQPGFDPRGHFGERLVGGVGGEDHVAAGPEGAYVAEAQFLEAPTQLTI